MKNELGVTGPSSSAAPRWRRLLWLPIVAAGSGVGLGLGCITDMSGPPAVESMKRADGCPGCVFPTKTPNNAFYLQHASNYGDGCGQFSGDTSGYNGNQFACDSHPECFWNSAKNDCESFGTYSSPMSDANGLALAAGVTEAASYYYPRIAQGLPTLSSGHTIANLTLSDWLEWFKFPKQLPGESLQAFRDRAGVLVYYNRMELGLGRELGCSQFLDGYDAGHSPLIGQACYVTNYGQNFYEPTASLTGALKGEFVKNTVCITYRPSQPEGFQVQFWSFGENGQRTDQVQLDPMGNRQTPTVCTACHGGRYVRSPPCQYDSDCMGDSACVVGRVGNYCSNRHMAFDARFLPLNPYTVQFADDLGFTAPAGTACAQSTQATCQAVAGCTWNSTTNVCLPTGWTRFGQMERLRKITEVTYRSPLRPQQKDYINRLWSNNVFKQNQTIPLVTTTTWPYPPKDTAPAFGSTASDRWNYNQKQKDLWNNVFLPYCGTCHMAIQPQFQACDEVCNGLGLPFYSDTYKQVHDFNASAGNSGLKGSVCYDYHMPHAMPTQMAMWENEATVSGVNGGAPLKAVSALLQGIDQTNCAGLSSPATCNLYNGDDVNCRSHGCYYDEDSDVCHSAGCSALVSGSVNLAASDDRCGPAANGGAYGLKCDTVGEDYNGNFPGKCVPGCRWNAADPNSPARGCAAHYECRADNKCHACGRAGEEACTTSQSTVTNPCEAGAYLVGGNCVECTLDAHCAGKTVGGMPALACDTTLYKCVGCSAAVACGAGLTCDNLAVDTTQKSFQCVTSCGAGSTCSGFTWCNSNNVCLAAPELDRYQNISDTWAYDNQDKWYKIKSALIADANDPSPQRLEVTADTWSSAVVWPQISLGLYKSDGTLVGNYSDSNQYATIAGHSATTYDNWSSATKTNQTPGGSRYNIQSASCLKDPAYVGDGYYYIKAHNTTQGSTISSTVSAPGAFTLITSVQNTTPFSFCYAFSPYSCFWTNYTDAHTPYISAAVGDSTNPGNVYGNSFADVDWYRIKADSLGRVVVQINSVYSASGDVDFALYDSLSWSQVAQNTLTTPTKQTIPTNLQSTPFYQGTANRYYYVKVWTKNGGKNTYIITFGNPDNVTGGSPDPIDNTY